MPARLTPGQARTLRPRRDLVAEIAIDRVTHKPIKDSDKLVRVEHGRSIVATVVDAALVAEAIDLAKINAEVTEGIQRLGFGDDG